MTAPRNDYDFRDYVDEEERRDHERRQYRQSVLQQELTDNWVSFSDAAAGVLDFVTRLMGDAEYRKAESPIEQVMCAALRRLNWNLPLKAQAAIGPYRVDFLLADRHVIECDGRDFHTSDLQVARDQKRDAWLRGKGYVVHRFTGSDVHRNGDECARLVLAAAGLTKTA